MEASPSGGGGGARERIGENLQKALDDLRTAGDKATGDVRSQIDSAMQRIRDVSGDATTRAQDQASEWRSTLERATEDVRRELAKLAIKAQTSSASLDELEQEIAARRQQL
jgi:hypothetical protein